MLGCLPGECFIRRQNEFGRPSVIVWAASASDKMRFINFENKTFCATLRSAALL
jgi:hypothetical protein